MARIRTIKPEFWDHSQLSRASILARLTFVGLINMADDEGRGRADEDWLWGRLHAGQPPNVRRRWVGCMSELSQLQDDDGPLVVFYEVAGARYYWLTGFCRQQYIEKAGKSKLPQPPNSPLIPLSLPSGTGIREQGSRIREQGGEGRGESGARAPVSRPPPEDGSARPEDHSDGPEVGGFIETAAGVFESIKSSEPPHDDPPMLPGTTEGHLFKLAKRQHIQAKDETLRRYLRGWIKQKSPAEVERILMEPRVVGKGIIAIQDWYFNEMGGSGFLGEMKK